jgi:hypothetical protein
MLLGRMWADASPVACPGGLSSSGSGFDLLEMCGVDPSRDAQETWLDVVQERLRDDLQSLRADIEGDHDDIEEWDFLGGRIFAAVGSIEEESNPLSFPAACQGGVSAGGSGPAGAGRLRSRVVVRAAWVGCGGSAG